MKVGFCVYLCWLSFQDIREKSVSLWKLLLGAGIVLLWCIWAGNGTVLLWDCLPGAVCLLMAGITREQIGYADGIVVWLAGMCCGWKVCLQVAFGALLMASLWGLGSLCFGRKGRHGRVAWIPFFAVAYGMWLWGG